jgi:ribosomal protein L34E
MPHRRASQTRSTEASGPQQTAAPPARRSGAPIRSVARTPAGGSAADHTHGAPTVQHCDFCGAAAATVRRVALDRDYDRLLTPHRELYACNPCSERKEGRRLGLER